MKITIIAVGKVKEKFYRDAAAEYIKRLSSYCEVNTIEVDDEKTPEGLSDRQRDVILKKEGERILSRIPKNAYVIALAIEGEALSSVRMSDKIQSISNSGYGHIVFIIGGSLGLDKDILKKADYRLSFSKMTFPHQLMRVILLEQIYRSYRIINGHPYHK